MKTYTFFAGNATNRKGPASSNRPDSIKSQSKKATGKKIANGGGIDKKGDLLKPPPPSLLIDEDFDEDPSVG